MMKTILLLCNLFLTISMLSAQVEYEKRIEIELFDAYTSETVLTYEKEGLILRSKKKEKVDGEDLWKFQKYDTNLKKTESAEYSLDKKFFLDESKKTDDGYFMFFQNTKYEYLLASLDPDKMTFTEVQGTLPKKTRITDMAILGDYAYFKTFIKKEPSLMKLNWKTGSRDFYPLEIPGFSRKKTSVENLQVLEEANELAVYVKVFESSRDTDIYVTRFDQNGKELGEFNLTKNLDNNLTNFSSQKLNSKEYVYTGTYAQKSGKTSNGIYLAKAVNDKIDFIEFYNFTDLDEFLSYLSERREKKIERKKDRKGAKGKELNIDYDIASHDIKELSDGYLYVGEAFYPTYRTESNTTYIMNQNGQSSPVTQTKTVFTGYRYTHAVVAKFGKDGKLLWDRTFELRQATKPLSIRRFIKIADFTDNEIKLVFSSNNKVVSKSFNFAGKLTHDQETDEIETGLVGDQTKWSTSNLRYWYDEYFLAFGKQKIKNTEDSSVKKKRRVMFMSKVKYK